MPNHIAPSSNHSHNNNPSYEETPKKIIRMKLLPGSEKSQRTKSFNIDFSRMKEENESFRATTPQPMPLVTASCNIEKGKGDKPRTRVKSPDEKLSQRGLE